MIPIIESVKGLIGQIVDLGVNHIKPLLADIMSFAVNELFPAVSPLISMIISLVGTTLINAIKLVVDVIHGLLPVIEPVIQGIVVDKGHCIGDDYGCECNHRHVEQIVFYGA